MLWLKGPILYQFANLQVEHLSQRKGPQLDSFSNLYFPSLHRLVYLVSSWPPANSILANSPAFIGIQETFTLL